MRMVIKKKNVSSLMERACQVWMGWNLCHNLQNFSLQAISLEYNRLSQWSGVNHHKECYSTDITLQRLFSSSKRWHFPAQQEGSKRGSVRGHRCISTHQQGKPCPCHFWAILKASELKGTTMFFTSQPQTEEALVANTHLWEENTSHKHGCPDCGVGKLMAEGMGRKGLSLSSFSGPKGQKQHWAQITRGCYLHGTPPLCPPS